ncbi:MAG: hypothetical protein Q8P84_04665 [Deltaproteobacteria bacterium]|nr:hypothetical protein [Deltaproteobacteria bacterium]
MASLYGIPSVSAAMAPLNTADLSVGLFARMPTDVDMSLAGVDGDSLLKASAVLLPVVGNPAWAFPMARAVAQLGSGAKLGEVRGWLRNTVESVGDRDWHEHVRPAVIREIVHRQSTYHGPLATPEEGMAAAKKVAKANGLTNPLYHSHFLRSSPPLLLAPKVNSVGLHSSLYVKRKKEEAVSAVVSEVYVWQWFLLSILQYKGVRSVLESLRKGSPRETTFLFGGSVIYIGSEPSAESLALHLSVEGNPYGDKKAFLDNFMKPNGVAASLFGLSLLAPLPTAEQETVIESRRHTQKAVGLKDWVLGYNPRAHWLRLTFEKGFEGEAFSWLKAFLFANRYYLGFQDAPPNYFDSR